MKLGLLASGTKKLPKLPRPTGGLELDDLDIPPPD